MRTVQVVITKNDKIFIVFDINFPSIIAKITITLMENATVVITHSTIPQI